MCDMLDREGPVPIYQQIAQLIHDQITQGELAIGDPVPSEASLEADFRIARTTARRVARELRERGVAHTIRGQGTFVGEPGGSPTPRRIPIYRRIAEDIAARIKQGEIPPNKAIPGEKAMMREYGVAKVTARQAVACLREQGWVFTVPYRGTYVSGTDKWPSSEGF